MDIKPAPTGAAAVDGVVDALGNEATEAAPVLRPTNIMDLGQQSMHPTPCNPTHTTHLYLLGYPIQY